MRSLFVVFALGALALLARRWLDVVAVEGRSMAPALLPGDWLLAERVTYRRRSPRAGEVVIAPDPRARERELIKRVGRVRGGALELRGDNTPASTDSATFGALPLAAVEWRIVARYWPPPRIGRVPARARGGLELAGPLGGETACTFPGTLIASGE